MENTAGPTVPIFKQPSLENIRSHKVHVYLHTLHVNSRTWEHSPCPNMGDSSYTNYMDLFYQLVQSFTLLSSLRYVSEQYIQKSRFFYSWWRAVDACRSAYTSGTKSSALVPVKILHFEHLCLWLKTDPTYLNNRVWHTTRTCSYMYSCTNKAICTLK